MSEATPRDVDLVQFARRQLYHSLTPEGLTVSLCGHDVEDPSGYQVVVKLDPHEATMTLLATDGSSLELSMATVLELATEAAQERVARAEADPAPDPADGWGEDPR